MANKWKDKNVGVIRGGSRSRTRTTIVRDERDGSVAGKHIEHWNGRQDAVAMPKTLRVKAGMREVKDGE